MSGVSHWKTYPVKECLHVLSLGAGRQSSVMYLMAVAGDITPLPDVAIFADTGNEPPHVYEQIDYLKRFNDIVPIHIVTAGNIYDDSISALNDGTPWGAGRWVGPPVFSEGGGPIRRKCTQYYKTKPKEDEIRRLLKEHGKHFVIDWRGHTTNEIHWAKQDNRKYFVCRWPFLELMMNDSNVAAWALAHKHPVFKWSACEICPFRLRQQQTAERLAGIPESWDRITAMDGLIRDMSKFGLERRHFFNAAYVPMVDFVTRYKPDERADLFSTSVWFDCDSGECGL